MTRRKGCKFGRTKAGRCRKTKKRSSSLGRMSSRRKARRRSRR